MSRRSAFRSAAGIGALGLVSGLAVGSLAGTAGAAQRTPQRQPQQVDDDTVVAHVSRENGNSVDLFVADRHVQVHDPNLASALMHAATAG